MTSKNLEQEILDALSKHMTGMLARSVLSRAITRSGINPQVLYSEASPRLCEALDSSIKLFISDGTRQDVCRKELRELLGVTPQSVAPPVPGLVELPIRAEMDVVRARSTASALCGSLGFRGSEQVKVATAVSELCRNVVLYAGSGQVLLKPIREPRPGIEVVVSDKGPGIAQITEILRGEYRSKTGLGLGLLGTKRLMDHFDIQTATGSGTTVIARKYRS